MKIIYSIDLQNATQLDLIEIEKIIKQKEKEIKFQDKIKIRKENIEAYINGIAMLVDSYGNEVNYSGYNPINIKLYGKDLICDFYPVDDIEATEINFAQTDIDLGMIEFHMYDENKKCIYKSNHFWAWKYGVPNISLY